MKKILFLLFFCILAYAPSVYGRDSLGSLISPGELASPHAKYEGISNCTKCHKVGGGIPDKTCLDCHDKLAKKIQDKKGPHAKYTDPCVKCHSDHKGRKYKMIIIEEGKFDHDRTDYPLRDKHLQVKCDKCHKTEGVYTGLKQECVSCHKDEHKGRFRYKNDCAKCHNVKGWKDLAKFDHNTASIYTLKGKHSDVKCDKCHTNKVWRPIKSKNCLDCHKDEHKGQFKEKTCEACHNVDGWKKTSFDHNNPANAKYKLEGKHLKTPCDKCHTQGKYKPLEHKRCLDCHKDEHKGQFKDKTCESCHTVTDWKKTSFDHNSPSYKGYKLEGKHIKTPCDKCHTQGKYKPLEHKRCLDCHKDEHKGQFKDKTCESCHTVNDWKKTSFDHNNPANAKYKLEGKHLKTPCDKCHTQGKYKPLEHKRCLDCHKDEHKGQFKEKICESCHTVTDWKKTSFDHNNPANAKYKLEGKHLKTPCDKCHEAGKYKPVTTLCQKCHEKDDVHKKELGDVCKKCHTEAGWKPATLNHNQQTKFPLIGAHKTTDCAKCHKTKNYKTDSQKCVDCHKDVHKGKFKEACETCHTQFDWAPRKFDHRQKTGYELAGAHSGLVCQNCHTSKDNYKLASRYCSQCHTDMHKNQFGTIECSRCHTGNSWIATQFRHSETRYPLQGAHRAADCADCHRNRNYRGTTDVCYTCHQSRYASAPYHVERGYSFDCAQCHDRNSTSWNFKHQGVGANCASCHLSKRPATHLANPTYFPTTCEMCHTSYVSWSSHRHPAVSTGCYACHSSSPARPASHTSNPAVYTTTCENCHRHPAWTFNHTYVTGNCSACHSGVAPAPHTTYASRFGASCQQCHRYPSWLPGTFVHSFSSFPTNHKGYSSCSSCHPSQNYGNKGGCRECHTSVGAGVHNSSTNAGCLSCHPTGN